MSKYPNNFYKLRELTTNFFRQHAILKPRLIVAVSGGIDSVMLAHTLHSLQTELGWQLTLCHIDHGLRKSSTRDAEFVQEFADSLNLPLALYKAPTKLKNENLESWAREVRYSFLNRCLVENSANFIVTAHHKLDQVETFLFKLLSGRVLTQGRCIREIDEQRKIIRPFLQADKELINQAFQECGLKFVQDETNFDQKRTRNLIRYDLIAKLKTDYNKNIVQTLADIATKLSLDENFIETSVQNILSALEPKQTKSGNFKSADLAKFSSAVLWRLLRQIATNQIGEDAQKLGYKAYNILAEAIFAAKPHPQTFDLGQNITATISKKNGVGFKSNPPPIIRVVNQK
ncbi:MAG: tRNA lysidine(34) synthetase TilS [Deltaproteobacteria bacterium]|jgi:tRNA(Ile)-lysidine synthase|nr:tRNA lysidine(34) synthetase TilS [Deltaproteobacteria bacterium]